MPQAKKVERRGRSKGGVFSNFPSLGFIHSSNEDEPISKSQNTTLHPHSKLKASGKENTTTSKPEEHQTNLQTCLLNQESKQSSIEVTNQLKMTTEEEKKKAALAERRKKRLEAWRKRQQEQQAKKDEEEKASDEASPSNLTSTSTTVNGSGEALNRNGSGVGSGTSSHGGMHSRGNGNSSSSQSKKKTKVSISLINMKGKKKKLKKKKNTSRGALGIMDDAFSEDKEEKKHDETNKKLFLLQHDTNDDTGNKNSKKRKVDDGDSDGVKISPKSTTTKKKRRWDVSSDTQIKNNTDQNNVIQKVQENEEDDLDKFMNQLKAGVMGKVATQNSALEMIGSNDDKIMKKGDKIILGTPISGGVITPEALAQLTSKSKEDSHFSDKNGVGTQESSNKGNQENNQTEVSISIQYRSYCIIHVGIFTFLYLLTISSTFVYHRCSHIYYILTYSLFIHTGG